MNNRFLIVIFFGLQYGLTFSQDNSSSHKLEIGLGNEWNAFLSPSMLMEDEELLNQSSLWDNGTFQRVALRNSWKKEGGKYKLKLKANGSLGLFQTEQNSNRYSYRIGTSYRLKYASKKYFELAPEVYRKRREGINSDNAVLATPFSFTLIEAPVGFDFYLGNKSWLKTQIGYMYKNYDKSNDEMLRYHAPFLEASISKKWVNELVSRKLTVRSLTQKRSYQTRSLVGDFDEELSFREGSRDWLYQFTTISYDFSFNDGATKLGLGMHQTSRIDQSGNNGFHEVGPGVKFSTKSSKVGFSTNAKYTIRRYISLAPGEENDTPLKYNYLRLNAEVDYNLGSGKKIYARTKFINRTSNNPNIESRSFRDYFNGFVEVGFKVVF